MLKTVSAVLCLAGALFLPMRAAEAADAAGAAQELVVCSGWHALCSASPDCKISGERADCDCLRVNETHVVETYEIQDAAVRSLTLATCTLTHPCAPDEAPVCAAIASGRYEVDHVRYKWVSTYSYRGWCSLLQPPPVKCDPSTPGYSGNTAWAICDAAPCTEIAHPSDPQKPLSCQCRVKTGPFLGPRGTCTGEKGGIISSMPLEGWDFTKRDYTFAMPGYEFVGGACEALASDPAP